DDTVFTIKDGLYPDHLYRFYLTPENWSSDYNIFIEDTFNFETEEFLSCTQLCFTAEYPYYLYGAGNDTLFRYSTSGDEFIFKSQPDDDGLAISLNGDHMIYGKNKVDPNTLETELCNIQEEMDYWTCFDILTISDNGIFVGETVSYGDMVAYDLINKTLIHEIKSRYGIDRPKVSPNGEYVVLIGYYNPGFEIWKYNPDSLKYLRGTRIHGDYHEQDNYVFKQSAGESSFYLLNGNNLELWSCETEQLISSYNVDAEKIVQIDPVTKNIVAYGDEKLLIYDGSDFRLLWELRIDPNHIEDWPYYLHLGQIAVINSIVYTNNKKIDLKNYETVN
ncbi:MAG: hypothetical protein GY756_09740, partial [bacterium]|nr:hypothetical protein [bacterium]